MAEHEVHFEIQGSKGVITIDREAARNALSGEVVEGILKSLAQAEADKAVRVIIMTGAGTRVFCAGGDLSGMSGEGFLGGHDGRRRFGQLLTAFRQARKPSIARVNGHALAGGLGLMLACDFAVAADSAGFGTPEIDRGLFPMMVVALLQRHLGPKRALDMALTGERITAHQALAWGLVNRVVPASGLDAEVDALASTLAGKSQAVLALGRRAYFAAEDLALGPALELLSANLSLNVLADDAGEGVSAFLEKRPPKWNDR